MLDLFHLRLKFLPECPVFRPNLQGSGLITQSQNPNFSFVRSYLTTDILLSCQVVCFQVRHTEEGFFDQIIIQMRLLSGYPSGWRVKKFSIFACFQKVKSSSKCCLELSEGNPGLTYQAKGITCLPHFYLQFASTEFEENSTRSLLIGKLDPGARVVGVFV